jgi:hypothetical protein
VNLGNRRIGVKSACIATAAVTLYGRLEFWEAGMIAEFAALALLVIAFAIAVRAMRSALANESVGAGRDERVRCASQELQRTVELGDDALRSLRDIVSHRRHDLISRA